MRRNTAGRLEYRIKNLTVNVHNTALASPGGTYYVEAGLTIEIPVCFGGKIVSNLSIPLRVRAAYREKF